MKTSTPPVQTLQTGGTFYLNDEPIWNDIRSVGQLEKSGIDSVGVNDERVQKDEEYRRLHEAQIDKEKERRA